MRKLRYSPDPLPPPNRPSPSATAADGIDTEPALQYMRKVEQTCDSETYKEFLDIWTRYRHHDILDQDDVSRRIVRLFTDYPDLREGFRAFVPHSDWGPSSGRPHTRSFSRNAARYSPYPLRNPLQPDQLTIQEEDEGQEEAQDISRPTSLRSRAATSARARTKPRSVAASGTGSRRASLSPSTPSSHLRYPGGAPRGRPMHPEQPTVAQGPPQASEASPSDQDPSRQRKNPSRHIFQPNQADENARRRGRREVDPDLTLLEGPSSGQPHSRSRYTPYPLRNDAAMAAGLPQAQSVPTALWFKPARMATDQPVSEPAFAPSELAPAPPTPRESPTPVLPGGPFTEADVLAFLDTLRAQLTFDDRDRFLDIMEEERTDPLDSFGPFIRLLHGYPALLEGFNTLMAPDYRIECAVDQQDNQVIVSVVQQDNQVILTTVFPPAQTTTIQLAPNRLSPSPTPEGIDPAVWQYVLTVQQICDTETWKGFVDALDRDGSNKHLPTDECDIERLAVKLFTRYPELFEIPVMRDGNENEDEAEWSPNPIPDSNFQFTETESSDRPNTRPFGNNTTDSGLRPSSSNIDIVLQNSCFHGSIEGDVCSHNSITTCNGCVHNTVTNEDPSRRYCLTAAGGASAAVVASTYQHQRLLTQMENTHSLLAQGWSPPVNTAMECTASLALFVVLLRFFRALVLRPRGE